MTNPNEVVPLLQTALGFFQQGDLPRAGQICRKVLRTHPDHPGALQLLGIIAFRLGNNKAAIDLISRAIAADPHTAEYHNNLGLIFREQGNPEAAVSRFREAIRLSPENAQAHNNLGLALRDQQLFESAILSYREALRLNPSYDSARNNLGVALQDCGRLEEAIACFREVVHSRPGFAEARNNLGYALERRGLLQEALNSYREAIRLNTAFPEAFNNLGNTFQQLGRIDEAVAAYAEALRLKPGYFNAHINIGYGLREQGRAHQAASQFELAISLNPKSVVARLGYCIAQIPCLYETARDIEISRGRYDRALCELNEWISVEGESTITAAAEAIGSAQPFYLAFQGENDRDLQRRYGALVSEIQAARYPQWKAPPQPEPLSAGQPVRVGIISAFFNRHSNWKVPIKGWIDNLDRERFSLYGYYTGKKKDDATALARRTFEHFVEDAASFESLCSTIRQDRLHVLIYPEIGMDPTTVRLAALRLAPIQCNSWGHPDTSGLSTIDYFLSSDLMEPADGQEHYTERLVRLPNLSIYYTPPELPVPPVERKDLGLREGAVVYSCVHSILTYLPQFDDLFARIAQGVGNCQFVFLGFSKSVAVTGQFRSRLDRAFNRNGLRAEDYLVFLPHLDPARFQAAQRLADVLLDSIAWSGCNTTLEAMTWDLPVVTLPGDFMRGRHSCAILTMMGVTDTIVATTEDYVRTAVRLGREVEFRREIAARIACSKHRIYRDTECIRGLERFLEEAVERHGLRRRVT